MSYFKRGTPLAVQQQKYCRCVAHVQARGTARVPYAACAKTTGTSARCFEYYDFKKIPETELKGLAALHHLQLPKPYSHEALIEMLETKQVSKRAKKTKKASKKSAAGKKKRAAK
jgi:hypothetical protein